MLIFGALAILLSMASDSTASDGPIDLVEEGVGHRFGNRALLNEALIHRSFVAENPGSSSYERLEWLGDAVLQVAVTDYIFRTYTAMAEGEMAKVRAAIVNENVLAGLAVTWNLPGALKLGRGEETTDGRHKPSILSDTVESVIGAIYLDAGHEAAVTIVLSHLQSIIDERAEAPGKRDYKTRLQEVLAKTGDLPVYRLDESGPEHAKEFVAEVWTGERRLGTGAGTSKKRAEQSAARRAFLSLEDDQS